MQADPRYRARLLGWLSMVEQVLTKDRTLHLTNQRIPLQQEITVCALRVDSLSGARHMTSGQLRPSKSFEPLTFEILEEEVYNRTQEEAHWRFRPRQTCFTTKTSRRNDTVMGTHIATQRIATNSDTMCDQQPTPEFQQSINLTGQTYERIRLYWLVTCYTSMCG